ncbi:unnamed protein product [Knipowitschia caucasica]
MLARLLYSLLNRMQVVEKLAESRPIRRAAQLTAYTLTKARILGQDTSKRVLRSQTLRQIRDEASRVPRDVGDVTGRIRRVGDTFMSEVKEGLKQGSRAIKK